MDTTKTTTETIIRRAYDTAQTMTHSVTNYTESKNCSLITLEYIKVLVWPLIILFVIIKYQNQIAQLIDRIINDSEEINSSFLGFSAKLRRNISLINTDEKDPEKLKKDITEKLHQNILDEFKFLSTYFFTKSFEIRKQTATEISKISQNLTFKELSDFALSSLPGERVAAYIGIKTHLNLFSTIEKDESLPDILRTGLDDGYSRVRFRVIQAIGSSLYLTNIFKEDLKVFLSEETNNVVKGEIKKLLKK